MAIYHCTIKTGSRAKGQSAIAASAYRSGMKLLDKETGLISDYTRKGGVVHSEVSLCQNAPSEYANRENLWNSVHQIEKASNARLWREIEVALPQEFSRTEQIEVVREYVESLTNRGMCADWSIHDKSDGNPHAHIMLTTRSIDENGAWTAKSRKVYDLDENGKKIYQSTDKHGRKQYKSHKEDYNDWNNKERVEEWRETWANVCNKYLSAEKKIDHRSYERQGKEKEPTIHEGYAARQIESKGCISELCQVNREIKARNILLQQITEQLKAVGDKLKNLLEQKEKTENLENDIQKNSIEPLEASTKPIHLSKINNTTVRSEKPQKAVQSVSEQNIVDYEKSIKRYQEISDRLVILKKTQIMKSEYKQYKPLREKYDNISKKLLSKKKCEEFAKQNEKELQRFNECLIFLKKIYSNKKLPSDSSILKEIEVLENEKISLSKIIESKQQEKPRKSLLNRLKQYENKIKKEQSEKLSEHARNRSIEENEIE